jgi:hypothetical protein
MQLLFVIAVVAWHMLSREEQTFYPYHLQGGFYHSPGSLSRKILQGVLQGTLQGLETRNFVLRPCRGTFRTLPISTRA